MTPLKADSLVRCSSRCCCTSVMTAKPPRRRSLSFSTPTRELWEPRGVLQRIKHAAKILKKRQQLRVNSTRLSKETRRPCGEDQFPLRNVFGTETVEEGALQGNDGLQVTWLGLACLSGGCSLKRYFTVLYIELRSRDQTLNKQN